MSPSTIHMVRSTRIPMYPNGPRRSCGRPCAPRTHRESSGSDILADELAEGTRIVAQSAHWVAYVPFAARWPVEVHLAPRRDDRTCLP